MNSHQKNEFPLEGWISFLQTLTLLVRKAASYYSSYLSIRTTIYEALTQKLMIKSFRIKLNDVNQCCQNFSVLSKAHITNSNPILTQCFNCNCSSLSKSQLQLWLSLAQLSPSLLLSFVICYLLSVICYLSFVRNYL